MTNVLRFFFLSVTTLAAPLAYAEELTATHDEVAIYGGQYSVLKDSQYKTELIGLEYRWKDQWNGLRPVVGFWGNNDSAKYAYGGMYWDFPLGPFMITPGVAVGGYAGGDSKDLGYGIEFRDTIEITYRFESGQRIGAQLTHMSNASLGDSNPGVETLQAVYVHPLW